MTNVQRAESGRPDCRTCRHRRSCIAGQLPKNLLNRLNREKTVHTNRRAQGLYYEASPPLAIHVIYSGSVKLCRIGVGGEELVIRVRGPGELLGYRAALVNEPHSTTAEALTETQVCTIPRELLLDLVAGSPELAQSLLARLARELRVSEDLMMDLTQKPVSKRLADLLLELQPPRKPGSAPGATIRGIKRKDMARMIGTTPESVSRTLHWLEQRGAVRVSRSEIEVCNPSSLLKIAGRRVPFDIDRHHIRS
jgi:CRP-like cAMP-binding protein